MRSASLSLCGWPREPVPFLFAGRPHDMRSTSSIVGRALLLCERRRCRRAGQRRERASRRGHSKHGVGRAAVDEQKQGHVQRARGFANFRCRFCQSCFTVVCVCAAPAHRQAPIDQFSKRPTTIPHLPPDRIAFVSLRVPHAQEVPEDGVTLSSLRVRYAPFGESPRVLPRSGSSLAKL